MKRPKAIVLTLFGGTLLVTALFVFGWIGPGTLAPDPPRRETAPEDWYGFHLGMTRREAADHLAALGVVWEEVQLPSKVPGPPPVWVNFENVTFSDAVGEDAVQFLVVGLRFADSATWEDQPGVADHVQDTPTEVVDPAILIGALAPDSPLEGIRCRFDLDEDELETHRVPAEVLAVLGKPHTVLENITGVGRDYLWAWPEMDANYYSTGAMLRVLRAHPPPPEPEPGPARSADLELIAPDQEPS